VRVGLIADIHANMVALEQLLPDLRRCDVVLGLGDYTGYYTQVNEVIATMREMDVIGVLGNHDDFVLHGIHQPVPDAVRFGVDYAARVIEPANRAWLEALPATRELSCAGMKWLLCHGSPWRPLEDYMYAGSALLAETLTLDVDVVAFGQTHRPLLLTDRRPRLVNPGASGQSRQAPAVATAVVFDSEADEWASLERPYDPAPVLRLARAAGAGAWVEKHLV